MDGIGQLFTGMRASATGLSAERIRIDVIAKNLANAETTRTPSGGPYRRQVVHFEPLLRRLADGSKETAGVRVARVADDMETPLERIFDPHHPDADGSGYVTMPNVNATREMADLITAMRAYEANMSAQESYMRRAERALRLAQ
jgi:flagellar basal-body rod protein FlgC